MNSQALDLKRKKQDTSGVFYIGSILDRKIDSSKRKHYLIKWRDYPASFNSWEPYEGLKQAWDLIKEFELKLKQKNSISKSLLGSKRKKSESKPKAHSQPYTKKIESESKKRLSVEKQKNLPHKSAAESTEPKAKKSAQENSINLKINKEELKNRSIYAEDLVITLNQNEIYPSAPLYVMHLDIFLDGRLSALVRWENKETSSVCYNNFRAQYPQKLLDFFESRITFPFDNSGTKIFKEAHKAQEVYKEDSL